MKRNVIFAVMTMAVALMTACSSDDDFEPVQSVPQKGEPKMMAQARTVLVYMAGRNSLADYVNEDLDEMKQGSKRLGSDDNLLVFVRRDKSEEQPWLARIKNGVVTDSVSLSDMGITSSDGENHASDPLVMGGVMRYAYSHYPAAGGNYGLVLWGHGTGWLMNEEVRCARSRAFGLDYGNSGKSRDNSRDNGNGLWINIPTMAEIISGMPHLKFIMADCCNFMCLEILYELRNVCDYIIGSPAEIPDMGAPYDQIVPDLFADGHFYTSIIDKYYQSCFGQQPLTAVQTNQMEQLAQATRQAMQAVQSNLNGGYADMTGLIHYYHTDKDDQFLPEYNIFYDAGDFFLAHAPRNVYQQWKQALDKAVIVHRNATSWGTDKSWSKKYSDFTATDAKMHGVSMYVCQDPTKGNNDKYNKDIKKMAWWNAIN